MANNLQRQALAGPSADLEPNKSDANSTVQAHHDASSNRTQSVAAPSTRALTPEPSSARRGPPVAAGSLAFTSQRERTPAEDILRDLIETGESLKDGQVDQARLKRPREDGSDDEPSSKRDKLGEELEKLGMEASLGSTAPATTPGPSRLLAPFATPEPQRHEVLVLVTPPDSSGPSRTQRVLPIRSLRGRRSRRREANASTVDDQEGSSDDETYRPAGNTSTNP